MKVIELYDAAHRNKNEDSFHMTVYDQTGMEILAYVFKDGKLPRNVAEMEVISVYGLPYNGFSIRAGYLAHAVMGT